MVAAPIPSTAASMTNVPRKRALLRTSSTRYAVTAARQIATTNSYMLPHGQRDTDRPRATTPPACSSQPNTVTRTANRPQSRRGAASSATVPASSACSTGAPAPASSLARAFTGRGEKARSAA